ncbi:ACP S-malonyltransferase [Methylobacterium indicum]|uniref:ACP S-malonyltransferase n=1 Tax=Methylobacterium indicum TaxID=1775910 RepID=UPI0009EC8F8F|nr:ACP S-malonyltransferase [Methylobacterium indicum]
MQAWVFPGQGSQRRGMGQELFPLFENYLAIADRVLDYSIKELCLENPSQRLNQTKFTQPAIFVVNALSAMQAERHRSRPPEFHAGFSLGEYNALLAAGAFDFETGLRLVEKRASLMDAVDGGSMAAVIGLDASELEDFIEFSGMRSVSIANFNTHDQLVISGPKADVDRLKRMLEAHPNVSAVVPLKTSGAFHSPLMKPAAESFATFLEGFSFSALSVPVVSNITGRPHRQEDLKRSLSEQIFRPVLWSETIQYLLTQGVDDFSEIGDTNVLRPMIKAIRQADPRPRRTAPFVPRPDTTPLLTRILERCGALDDRTLQIFHRDGTPLKVTGGEIAAGVRRLGSRIAACTEPQARVVVLLPFGPDLPQALLACWYAGVVAVPVPFSADVDPDRPNDPIAAIIQHSGAECLVTSDAFADTARIYARRFPLRTITVEASAEQDGPALRRRPASEQDAAILLYTSGSTSQPKGVVWSHATVDNSALSPQWALSSRSRVVSWLPLHHAFGLNLGLLAPLAHGALSVCMPPENFVSAPQDWLALIDRYRATHTGGPSFLFDHCCEALDATRLNDLRLSCLGSLICGGDMIRFADHERFVRLLAPLGLSERAVLPHYGLSEAAPVTLQRVGEPLRSVRLEEAALLEGWVRPAPDGRCVVSCGEIDDRTRIEIVDHDNHRRCPAGRIGEIWVDTPCAAVGYWNDQEESRRVFDAVLADTGESGFLRTGDLGFVLEGHLYIVGRLKDIIIVNGKNYHSIDLEAALSEHLGRPGFACAAFAYETPGGQRVAIVQEVEDAPELHREIGLGIVDLMSRRFQLQVHEVVLASRGTIPLTASRKVRRQACGSSLRKDQLPVLWRWDVRQGFDPPFPAIPPDRIGVIARAVRDKVLRPLLGSDVNHLSTGDPISRLGTDSIKYIQIARKIEIAFDVKCPPSVIYKNNSCRSLAQYIFENTNPEMTTSLESARVPQIDEAVVSVLLDCSRGRITRSRALDMIKERL